MAWDRLAEVTGQFLSKGQLVDVERSAVPAFRRVAAHLARRLADVRRILLGLRAA